MTRREEIEPSRGEKRYARGDEQGQFTRDPVDQGRSLAADRRRHAELKAKHGEGDRGDE